MSECTLCEGTRFIHHLDCPSFETAKPEGSNPTEYTLIKRDGNFFKIRSIFLLRKCHKPMCNGNVIFNGVNQDTKNYGQYIKGDVYGLCDKCNQPFVWELTDEMKKRFNVK
jgi:hypothetical protein